MVKIGNDVITLDELRRQSAELPPANRPSLATRADRLAFVDDVIRRRLLLDHAQDHLAPPEAPAQSAMEDSAADRWIAREREDILLRRLQALEGGMGDPTDAELREAMEKSALHFRFRRVLFADLDTAKQTAAQWSSKSPPKASGKNESYLLLDQEQRAWSPWPIDAVLDAVAALEPGQVTSPLLIDGQVQVMQLLERTPRDSAKTVSSSSVTEGIRRRKRAFAFEALENRLIEQSHVTYDAEVTNFLASRIRDAILEGTPENEFNFAIPEISKEEGTRALAGWTARKGAASQVTAQDVVDALRRLPPARRPMRGPLAGQVQRVAEAEVSRRLLLEEASRRTIEQDWWAERQIRRLEDERLLRLAMRRIEDEASFSEGTIDSLTALLLSARPNLLQEATRARVVRIDCVSRESALKERELILGAKGALARYAQVLDGRALSAASYHFLSLTPGGVGSPELERAIFQHPARAVQGPFLFGQTWLLFETIALEPEHQRAQQEVRAEVSQNFRDGQGAAIVEAWVQGKRKEVGVTIHEDVLDHLGPGA